VLSGPLLAIDWGTTSRRGWLLGDDGEVLASAEDSRGMLSIPAGGWEDAFAKLKHALGAEPRLSLIAGMAGANRGWSDAGYVACPATADDLARGLCWVEPGSVAIVPGLSVAGDVMRGEETQIFGAIAAGLAPPDCLACHPGTHTKWVAACDGQVTGFRTVMTGELFALLKEHSILAPQMQDEPAPGRDFDAGLARGLATGEAIADLFAVRADLLSGAGRIGNGAAYASGLLIGADVRAGLAASSATEVHVIGRPDLAALYASAIDASGRRAVTVDGGAAVLAGLWRIAETIE
jgi:2-dehydro-3-deoxygalactonokinase